jgi:hypothetical protein
VKTGAQDVGRRLGLFYCLAIWSSDGGEQASLHVRRREYAENLCQMRRAFDWGAGDGFLPGQALEVRELRLVARRETGSLQPGYQPGTSPCVQVRTKQLITNKGEMQRGKDAWNGSVDETVAV